MYCIFPVFCLCPFCILPVSCLYFSTSCCISQILSSIGSQISECWLCVCIAAASPTHHSGIAVALLLLSRIAIVESHRGRSVSFARCRRLDDFIGISLQSFSSGLWAERRCRHLSKARSNCCESMHWRNQTGRTAASR